MIERDSDTWRHVVRWAEARLEQARFRLEQGTVLESVQQDRRECAVLRELLEEATKEESDE